MRQGAVGDGLDECGREEGECERHADGSLGAAIVLGDIGGGLELTGDKLVDPAAGFCNCHQEPGAGFGADGGGRCCVGRSGWVVDLPPSGPIGALPGDGVDRGAISLTGVEQVKVYGSGLDDDAINELRDQVSVRANDEG